MKITYQDRVETRLKEGIVEKVPVQEADGERIFHLPHKPVAREEAATTKIYMVFDPSAMPSPIGNSLSEYMYTGPALQPQLWDIMMRVRISAYLLIGDLQNTYLQMGMTQEDRDVCRFLFNINNKEQHLCFARALFGGEAGPFIYGETIEDLLEKVYVGKLMTT